MRACVDAGTHYADITGEAFWVAEMRDKYGELTELRMKLTRFCKNAPHLAVLRFRSLEEEYAADAPVAAEHTHAWVHDGARRKRRRVLVQLL